VRSSAATSGSAAGFHALTPTRGSPVAILSPLVAAKFTRRRRARKVSDGRSSPAARPAGERRPPPPRPRPPLPHRPSQPRRPRCSGGSGSRCACWSLRASMRANPVAIVARRPERLFSGSKPESAWVLGSFGRIGLSGPPGPVERTMIQIFLPYHGKISKARGTAALPPVSPDRWCGSPRGTDRSDEVLVEVLWSEDAERQIAVVPALPCCSTLGRTPEAAVHANRRCHGDPVLNSVTCPPISCVASERCRRRIREQYHR
jgi:hypothetical protein